MVDRAGFAELRAGSQGSLLLLLLLLVLATAAAHVILGAHAAALLVLGAPISAVKSFGAAEAQMRHIGELKLETLAAFQACVRGRPCKHHTRTRARARTHTHTHTTWLLSIVSRLLFHHPLHKSTFISQGLSA